MFHFKRSTLLLAFLAFAIFSIAIVLWIVLSIAKIDEQERARALEALNSITPESVATDEAQPKPQIESAVANKGATAEASQKTKLPFNVQVVYSDSYLIDLGGAERLHPFDIKKYQKIHQALVDDELLTDETTLRPEEISIADVLLVHSKDYLKDLTERKKVASYLEAPVLIALPVSLDKGVLQPFRFATGGTLLAARESLKHGIGVNIGGGYHHAKPNTGEGFCIYADVPIAIRKLQAEGLIKRALVIDVDVHQGNGTILCLENDDTTFTFSMHQGGIYPNPKEVGDKDVELDDGLNDEQFLEILNSELPNVFEQAEADICFIVGGCDTLAGDPLASLRMTHDGIVKRDAAIVAACVERKIPVVYTTSGGYSDEAWKSQYLSIKNMIETYSYTN